MGYYHPKLEFALLRGYLQGGSTIGEGEGDARMEGGRFGGEVVGGLDKVARGGHGRRGLLGELERWKRRGWVAWTGSKGGVSSEAKPIVDEREKRGCICRGQDGERG